MRLGLVDGPGHHGPLMSTQLLARGHEVIYTRPHPGFAVRDGARDITPHIEKLLHDRVRQIVAGVRHRLGSRTLWDFDLYTRLYGRLAARHLNAVDAVIAFSFVAEEALAKARLSVLELPATHLRSHLEIVEREHAQAGAALPPGLSERAVERAEREYARADFVHAISSYARKTLIAHGVPESKIIVTPLGVDLERFRAAEKSPGSFRVLCVGRVELAKGVRQLCQAFSRLRLANAELELIGAVDEAARPFVSGCTLTAPLSPAALAERYRSADLLVFPSLSDGLGLVMLEAMASGLPVIATDHSGGPDVVGDGGFVVPAGDAEALADRIDYLHRHRDERLEMGRRARAIVERDFSELRYGERLERDLIAVLADRRGSARAPRESAARPSPR